VRRPGAGDLLLAAALGAIVLWPAAATVVEALRGGDNAPGGGLIDPAATPGLEGVGRPLGLAATTLALVAATAAMALPVGVALAFLLARTDLPGRRAAGGLLAILAFVPLPMVAAAWIGGFGNLGRSQAIGSSPVLVGLGGAAVVHALAALPWVVLLVAAGLRAVEPELEEAGRIDRPPWRVVMGVTLRRSLGAIAGAALAVAVLTAGDMTVTDLLVVRTYAEEAYVQYQLGRGAAAAAVAVPPLIVLGTAIGLGATALLKAEPSRRPSTATRPRAWRLGGWRWPLATLVAAGLGVLVGLPLFALGWRAGRVGGVAAEGIGPHWSWQGLATGLARAGDDLAVSLPTTVALAAAAATISAILGWLLAWWARKPGARRWIAAGVVALLWATPGPVAGMSLVLAYRDVSIVYDTEAIVVLAYVMRTLPYAAAVLWPALRAIPAEYLEAAELEGYGAWGVFRRVSWPQARGAAAAAWLSAFALALGELPASNLVAPPGVDILSVYVWGLLHTGVESRTAAVGLILALTTAAAGAAAAIALALAYGRSSRDEALAAAGTSP